MPRFQPGRTVKTDVPKVIVDPTLPAGRHRFTLVVVDEQGVQSEPAELIVTIRPLT